MNLHHICVKLNIALWKLFRWFRMLLLWAAGDWQLQHNMLTHRSLVMQSFLAKSQITQVTQHPHSPDLVPCDFWPFQKLKSPLKRKRFQTISEIEEYMTGSWLQLGKLYMKCQCAYFEGNWDIIVLCTTFLISSSINVSVCHITWLDIFWTNLMFKIVIGIFFEISYF